MQCLDHEDIARRIPHAGAMCLLSRVVCYDATSIECEAESHAAQDNPLRAGDRLPASAGIEYAAQAIALHAALQKADGAPAGRGYLAVLSDVRWSRDRLDDLAGPLLVRADLLADTGGGLQYRFALAPRGGAPVLEGVQVIAKEASGQAV